ncbi:hypothetical protein [Hankyongella ginsenosidimutans]|uniref:hypothetical protein n=1 Tax=Hankyongella ginsenosidimutans TaxID=1763828 RepID=UPI001FE8444B|nr:hypothetical protein [Hankyongella ginsenosidimutans]
MSLAVFPEAFLGGYPKGVDFGARVGSRSPEGASCSAATPRPPMSAMVPRLRASGRWSPTPGSPWSPA